MGAGVCAVALALSCGVFFAFIAPLNPPAQEVKLITQYYSLEEIPVSGYSKVQHQQNEDLKSQNSVEGDATTTQTDSREEQVDGDEGNAAQGVQINGFDALTGAVRYFIDHPLWLLVFPAIALVIALVIAIKKLLRRRRFEKMCALAPAAQVKAFYLFFEKRLALFGITHEGTRTPIEHAQNAAASNVVFEAGADGATYLALARDYCDATYGAAEPGEQALENCRKLYGVFYRNACQSMGRLKYAFTRFFRI